MNHKRCCANESGKISFLLLRGIVVLAASEVIDLIPFI